ncbi:MAG: hypothetical protein BGO11_00815 [Solirubrobacterales bacterium 70-9]|nr:MAG: hypothetical protein BGO11_00815 [Solirubrobacterales bacterium 70-9]
MPLEVRGLTKAFGGELALDGVDLDIGAGEIHALLGPNGSGKSTLIGCLSGRLVPDRGSMAVGGKPVSRFTPRSALAAHTAVIYQHFSLAPTLSVADNVFLGSEHVRKGGLLDRRRQRAETQALLNRLGVDIDPRAPVSALSVGQKQLVEIAKALRHEPELLILDEPTAALGEAEARALGRQLIGLRNSGLSILYVTHLLGEVFEIADKVTVLRDGRVALRVDKQATDRGEILRAIAPAGGAHELSRSDAESPDGTPVLELRQFRAPGVGPIDLRVGKGEVVAVFGLLGSGRSELLEALYGLHGRTGGTVSLQGETFVPRSPSRSLRRGVALVPADRARQSVFADLPAIDNMLLPHLAAIGSPLWRSRRGETRTFTRTAEAMRLAPPVARAPARSYSGGNQQKLVVGRWLASLREIGLLLLDEPTQGIDIGARGDLYELVRGFAATNSRGVLFTSSDPDEVLALADRVLVIARGRLVAELRGSTVTAEAMLDQAHQQGEMAHV